MIRASIPLTGLLFFFAPHTHAADISLKATDILSAVTGYTSEAGYFRAILIRGSEDADLLILTEGDDGLAVSVHAKDIAFTGIGGSDASLSLTDQGSLRLHSENYGIGRHKWEQTLTIVYRDGTFVVGGFTYSFADTLARDDNGEVLTGSCDLNLLSGKGVSNGKPARVATKAKPVTDWSAEDYPEECP